MIHISYRFDDGDISQYKEGFMTLLDNKQVGSFYIITDKLCDKEYINKDQLKEMAKHGCEIGSHSVSHCEDWHKQNNEIIKKEMLNSKEKLKNLGHNANIFCFPRMKTTPKTETIVQTIYTAYFKKYITTRIIKLNKSYIPSIPTKFGINTILNLIKKPTKKPVWIVITIHKIVENKITEYDTTIDEFKNIVKTVYYGIKKGTHKCVTVEEGYQIFS